MTTITDAARAVATVAQLIDLLGDAYAHAVPSTSPTGSYSKWHHDLVIELEWLATARLDKLDPGYAADIRDAAVTALVALEQAQINEYFYAALKTALADEPEGDSRV